MSIDHGALRLQPLLRPGWARQGVVYGPFERSPGLVVGVAVNNGHNTSHGGPIPERFVGRVRQWIYGPFVDSLANRFSGWLRSSQHRRATARRLCWWFINSKGRQKTPEVEENLALGFFASEAPSDPRCEGSCFIMHAAEAENGELWLRVAGRCLPVFRRLKNVPLYYVVALRERGACYYIAGPKGAHGVGAFPKFRPVGIDPTSADARLFAGLYQAALGQIGFRVDTRVQSIQVARSDEWREWYGSAHAADALWGRGELMEGDRGGAWQSLGGELRRTARGVSTSGDVGEGSAVLSPLRPSGLVHASVVVETPNDRVALLWQTSLQGDGWRLEAWMGGCRLVRRRGGRDAVIAEDASHRLFGGRWHSLQVLEGFGEICCSVDGKPLFGGGLPAGTTGEGTGIGLWLKGAGARVSMIEAHPPEVEPPTCLGFDPPWRREGDRLVYADDFKHAPGELAGLETGIGKGCWQRTLGNGSFIADGHGRARVMASVATPNPGRTVYTLPWAFQDFADLEVALTPPGQRRGEGHRGRAGLVFWQDDDNYVTCSCWLDDVYDGASISFFPKLGGFEELYDAVWTNVDGRVAWGREVVLRLIFDGDQFVAYLDGEPVLQKALRDLYPTGPTLKINRVGLVANWEWGDDTGSSFGTFRARA
ncbi:MAG: oxidoreductase [Hyphomicrobiaceae bacterium]